MPRGRHRAGRHPPARRLRPRPARSTSRALVRCASRGCSGTPPAAVPARRGRGWAASTRAPVSVWRMTSDQAPVLWPFIAAPGLPPTGAQMGIDVLSGGSFYLDPFGWVLRDDVPVTNPNVICFGKPGRGKSATTKAFILRMMDFGYRTLILGDPKDEYEPLCAALGVRAVPDRARPARPDQPAGVRAAGPRLGPPGRRAGPGQGRGRVRAVAHPDPRAGRVPTRR